MLQIVLQMWASSTDKTVIILTLLIVYDTSNNLHNLIAIVLML
jgi:hypothetical protein